MSREEDEEAVSSTWARAYRETPKRVRELIGYAIFVAQAFISFAITQSRSFFITHPTLTVGLISGFVIVCLFGMVYGLAREDEESQSEQSDQVVFSEENTPFTNLQLTVIDQMVTEIVRRDRLKQRPSWSDDSQDLASEFDDLLKRVEEIEETQLTEEDISSLESKIEEVEETQLTEEDTSSLEPRVKETQLTEEDISPLKSEVRQNRRNIRTVYRTVKQNVEEFDPPQTGEDSEKSQEDTPSSDNREETESEKELE